MQYLLTSTFLGNAVVALCEKIAFAISPLLHTAPPRRRRTSQAQQAVSSGQTGSTLTHKNNPALPTLAQRTINQQASHAKTRYWALIVLQCWW